MNEAEILRQADKVLKELEEDINSYHPLAWGIPWDMGAVERLQEIVAFYERRKKEWMRMLAGASEITKEILLEFMRCADLEIEGAKSVLFMIQGKKRHRVKR
jgi:hypothetical protein